MATLAESFLADLDDLSDGSGDDDRGRNEGSDAEELPDAAPSVAPGATLASTASLEPSPRYASIMQRVRDALTAGDAAAAAPAEGAAGPEPTPGAAPPPMPPPPSLRRHWNRGRRPSLPSADRLQRVGGGH